jgi:hypothetical protein
MPIGIGNINAIGFQNIGGGLPDNVLLWSNSPTDFFIIEASGGYILIS